MNYHCSHIYTNTELSLICPLDFCTVSYRLSSSHWIFFVIILHNVLSQLHVTLLQRGCLTEWTIEKEAVTEREKDRRRREGVATASFSTESLGDNMHIHKTHFHLSWETVAMQKINTYIQQSLLNMQAVQWRSCEKDACLTWLRIQSVEAGDVKKGRRGENRGERRISI